MRSESVRSFSDEEIVRLILDGAEKLFGILVERYRNKIYVLGLRFFRNADDAADYAQDVFIKAYEGLAGFKGKSDRDEARGRARFFSWLMSIAYNHGINSVKRDKSLGSLVEDFSEILAGDPAYDHERKEVRNALVEAMKDLPENYGICLDLFFFQSTSF